MRRPVAAPDVRLTVRLLSPTSACRSVWDHPCDDYYKNMYKEEKQKLAERKVKDAEKVRAEKEAKACLLYTSDAADE